MKIAVLILMSVFIMSCSSEERIDRQGALVYEFNFRATPTQRDEYLDGVASLSTSLDLQFSRDFETEQAIRERENKDIRLAYLTSAKGNARVLVAMITDINEPGGVLVQLYSGGLSHDVIEELHVKLVSLSKTEK